MSCTFFGSRDTLEQALPSIENAILELIRLGVVDFYVGNNGNFDHLAQLALIGLRGRYEIKIHILLAYINEMALSGFQDYTEFCEGLENVPKRFAICRRNNIMLQKATFVITNAHKSTGNSRTWLSKAIQQGKKIIYI